MRYVKRFVHSGLALVLLAVVLAACMPPTPPVPPAPAPTCQPLEDDANARLAEVELTPENLFIPDQVVLTGRKDDISRILEDLRTFELTPLGLGIDLSYLNELGMAEKQQADPSAAGAMLPWPDYDQLTIQLVQIGTRAPVPLVIQEVYASAQKLQVPVAADPNYVVGSPWEIEGSPWEIEGSTITGAAISAEALFWTQWGFLGPAGIATGESLQPASRTLPFDGQGVTIAVFDTAPFDGSGLQPVAHITPTLNLCVTKLLPAVVIDYPNAFPPDLSDHGLFVSGLGFGVAPGAGFHLIEVLDRTARGDLVTLLKALNLFIQQHGQAGTDLPLGQTVINLSLGVPDPATAGLAQKQVVSLETLMITLKRLGAVVVAAAGNGSANTGGTALPPQSPAALPSVIGVAASNDKGDRSCYANAGDVAAPGGDGAPNAASGASCAPALDTCAALGGDCGAAVISLTRTGYAYWVGSSFATPMVSGAAALLLEAGVQPGDVLTAVKTAGAGSPDLGKGVVTLAAGIP